jgi:trk system potassium uptake protein TrkH
MQFPLILNILGFLYLFLSLTMIFPLMVSFIYSDGCSNAFLSSIAITALSGAILYFMFPSQKKELSHRDGFSIVTLGWSTAALFGSLPFILSGSINSFTNAYFETMSGFTTTGATICLSIEELPQSILFWRSFIQWLGGMGIILFSIAILPLLGVGGMELYKAEVPGPTPDKIKPRIAETARTLWKVYLLMSALEVIMLCAGGMNLFDSLCHTFTTLATGGFSTKNTSIEYYQSPYFEAVLTAFMLIAGINFSLHYRLLLGNVKSFWKNSELRFFFSVFLIASLIIAINLRLNLFDSFISSLRFAFFQVASIITTTGYSSHNFGAWPVLSQYLLLLLMFVGGCTGSTGGSIKCFRIILLLRQGYRELYRLIHPRAVVPIKMMGKRVSSETMEGVWGFVFLYILLFAVSSLIMTLLGLDLITAISSVAACIGNVGPGLNTVGPAESYHHFPLLGKWLLTLCMLIGRLEIYTVFVLFIPEFWKK